MIEPRIVVALINAVWQSAILVLFTAGIVRILGRTSANVRCVVWMAAFAVSICLPAFDYAFAKSVSQPAPAVAAAASAAAASHETAHSFLLQRSLTSHTNVARLHGAAPNYPTPETAPVNVHTAAAPGRPDSPAWDVRFAQAADRASGVFFALWIGIADLLLVRLVLQLVSLLRAQRKVDILNSDWFGGRVAERRGYHVGVSDDVSVPCLLGLAHPVIAIPRSLTNELSTNDLRRIVLHESAHVSRYDDWFNLFEQCSLALFFFNPALHYAVRQVHLEREIACDDRVVAASDRILYAECLSALARQTRLSGPSFAPGFLSGRRQLLVRIEQLLDRKHVSSARVGRIPYAMVGVLGAAAFVLGQIGIPVLGAAPHEHGAASSHIVSAPAVSRARIVIHAKRNVAVRPISQARPMAAVPKAAAPKAAGPKAGGSQWTLTRVWIASGKPMALGVVPVAAATQSEVTLSRVAPTFAATQSEEPLSVVAPVAPLSARDVEVYQIEDNGTAYIIYAPRGTAVAHGHPLSAADIKALRKAGCTVLQVSNGHGLSVAQLGAIRVETARSMAELRRSMQELNRVRIRDFSRQDMASMEAFARSQAQLSKLQASDFKRSSADLARQMAELARVRVHIPPMDMRAFARSQAEISKEMAALARVKMIAPEVDLVDAEMSLPLLPVKEITEMRGHGVTGSYIASLSRVGYSGLSAADLIRLHDHGVTAPFIEELQRAHPNTRFSVDDLIHMREQSH